jgi:protein TonB
MSRLLSIAIIAVFINTLIFSAIEYMVGSKRVRLTRSADVEIANFIRLEEDSTEVRSRRDSSAPQKPQQDLDQEVRQLARASSSSGGSGLVVEAPKLDIDVGPALAGDIRIARELAPLVRIQPDYPRQALVKKIEGFVLLRFVVTETGSVEDPEVLRSDPPGLFDIAAKRAVLRWKYQPQFRDGKPSRVVTMNRIVFMLDESASSGETSGS